VDDAAQQGVEADEAEQTMELRSLTPVFGGQSEVIEAANGGERWQAQTFRHTGRKPVLEPPVHPTSCRRTLPSMLLSRLATRTG
jgi:hypothetical protein